MISSCLIRRCLIRSRPSPMVIGNSPMVIGNSPMVIGSRRTMCVEKEISPNHLLGGIVKYGTILAASYVAYNFFKISMNKDSPLSVQADVMKMVVKDPNVLKHFGNDVSLIPGESLSNLARNIFQYPENGVMKLSMALPIRGKKNGESVTGVLLVKARECENPKSYKYNWVYEEISLKLDNGKVISIKTD